MTEKIIVEGRNLRKVGASLALDQNVERITFEPDNFIEKLYSKFTKPEEIYGPMLPDSLSRLDPLAAWRDSSRTPTPHQIQNVARIFEFGWTPRVSGRQGPVIYLYDGSGSMTGENILWTKAFGLVIHDHVRNAGRRFLAMQFAGPHDGIILDSELRTDGGLDLAHYCNSFLQGGTDWEKGLDAACAFASEYAYEARRDRYEFRPTTIVMVTDGICQVSEKFFENWYDIQMPLSTRFKMITMGGINEHPLKRIMNDDDWIKLEKVEPSKNARTLGVSHGRESIKLVNLLGEL